MIVPPVLPDCTKLSNTYEISRLALQIGINLMKIVNDNLLGQEIAEFLEQHIEDMKYVSPPESKHALDLEGLRSDDITFWSVYEEDSLVGCGALKELDAFQGEIKSMRIAPDARGNGLASKLLKHIIHVSMQRGYKRLSLETGSMEFFKPALKLYLNHGFKVCPPFASYKEDPNSIFMTLEL